MRVIWTQSGEEEKRYQLIGLTSDELERLGEALDLTRYTLHPDLERESLPGLVQELRKRRGEVDYREMADRIYAEVCEDPEILRIEGYGE